MQIEGVTYVDVMGYEPGVLLPYFSNPLIDLDGVSLGAAEGSPSSSDGARTISELAPFVKAYRTALSRIEFESGQLVCAETSGVAVVRLKRTGNLGSSTRANVIFDSNSPAKAGSDYTRPGNISVTFASGQSTVELSIPIIVDNLDESAESLRLTLSGIQGSHGIGSQNALEVIILDNVDQENSNEITFPEGPLAVAESGGEVIVKIKSTRPWQINDAPISYQTQNGSALAGSDYTSVTGTLNSGADMDEWEIAIPILERPEAGPDRAFSFIAGYKTNVIRILDEQRFGSRTGMPDFTVQADGAFNAKVRGDGKILVWGSFSQIGGSSRTGIALLNEDETVNNSFQPPEILLGHKRMAGIGTIESPSSNAYISRVRVQENGRLLASGAFSRVHGQPRQGLIRLAADGTLDETFGAGLTFDGPIHDFHVLPDGKIIIGGAFSFINGEPRPHLARLLANGEVDTSFQSGGLSSSWFVAVHAVAVQPTGKILIGGYFEKVNDRSMTNFARLNADGTVDPSFKLSRGANGPVMSIEQQSGGNIILGGFFDTVGDRQSRRVARLNKDGSNDLAFISPNPNGEVREVCLLPDGRLVISGRFTRIGDTDRRFVALLQPNGSLDLSFDPGEGPNMHLGIPAVSRSHAVSVWHDGSLFLAGEFDRFNAQSASGLVRLSLGKIPSTIGKPSSADGHIQFPVHGLPGGNYEVEATSDFKVWESHGTVRMLDYATDAAFLSPLEGASKFFRIKQ